MFNRQRGPRVINRLNRKNDDRGYGDKPQMHSATCAKCDKKCEVPFKPNGRKPIYCSDCFEKEDSRGPRNDRSRNSRPRNDRPRNDRPRSFSKPTVDNQEVVKQLRTLGVKMDRMIQLLMTIAGEKDTEEPKTALENEIDELLEATEKLTEDINIDEVNTEDEE